jgi:tRNA(Ile)-lysidine synthase
VTPAEVRERVRAGGLLGDPSAPAVVVLLSGGRDSVCLLDVAVAVAGGAAVRALHCNYGLREAAADDERHCAELCDRLGVPLIVERARRPPDASGNVHAWARDVRYAAGRRVAASAGARLAAGHTTSDQAETILYRLAASPGRRALLGMPDADGLLVRPLLRAGLSREDTADYCERAGLPWREDALNDDVRFARARVRGGLLAALRAVDGRAEANVLRTAALLGEEAEVLDGVVETVLAGSDRISLEHLAALPPALARLVVRRLAEAATGRLCPRAAARLGDLLSLQDGALDVGDGARAVTEEGVLRFERTPPLPTRPQGRRRRPMAEPEPGPRRQATRHRLPRLMAEPQPIGDVLVDAETLQRRVREMGEEISEAYRGKDLLLVGVLKGAVFFVADVMRSIDVPVEVDFMAVSSYGSATDSSGVVRILKDLDMAIEGRDVLIVEDIVDSGLTLQYLMRSLSARNPASLEVCALLTKPDRRKVDLPIRFVGFEIPDRFAIGYGLDHAERYRNLPYVAALDEG